MYFEILSLEAYATKAGLEVIKPARVKGRSGVELKFSFLAADKERLYAFELCPEVGQLEVLRTFIKRMDTGVTVTLVCLRGRPSEEGMKLAREYNIRVLSPADIGSFFKRETIGVIAGKKET